MQINIAVVGVPNVKITSRSGMNPFSGVSPLNRPDFQKVKEK